MLRAQIRRGGNGRAGAAHLALNDLVAMRSETGRVVGLDLIVDGSELTTVLPLDDFIGAGETEPAAPYFPGEVSDLG